MAGAKSSSVYKNLKTFETRSEEIDALPWQITNMSAPSALSWLRSTWFTYVVKYENSRVFLVLYVFLIAGRSKH